MALEKLAAAANDLQRAQSLRARAAELDLQRGSAPGNRAN
jgi:hypothetical protein